jgi:hypothetical protein
VAVYSAWAHIHFAPFNKKFVRWRLNFGQAQGTITNVLNLKLIWRRLVDVAFRHLFLCLVGVILAQFLKVVVHSEFVKWVNFVYMISVG